MSPFAEPSTVSAPAKINLSLNVRSARDDGFHEIDSIFFPLREPADSIRLEFPSDRTGGILVRCDHPDVPLDPEKNLCGRAVSAFCRAAGIPVPAADIFLDKQIPCAGGMGGGSSDAAAVLRLMEQRFAPLPDGLLAKVALSLGADVPFFLDPVPARVQGAGEKITPLPGLPDTLPLVLAAPDFPVSAKWAYDHWTPDSVLSEDNEAMLADALKRRDLTGAARFMKNSLSAPLFRKFPILQWLRDFFLDNGALCAEVTGSGPAMFALFPDEAAADEADRTARQAFPSIRFFRSR